MSSIFNEADADTIVRAVMLLHNKRIIIINEEDTMTFISGADGKVYKITTTQEVTRQELEESVQQARFSLSFAQNELAEFDNINGAQNGIGSGEQPAPASGSEHSTGIGAEDFVPPAPQQDQALPPSDQANPEPPATPAQPEQPQAAPEAATPAPTASEEQKPRIEMQ